MKKIIYWLAVFLILGIPFAASVEMLLMGKLDATAVVLFVFHLVGLIIAYFISKKIFKSTKKEVKKDHKEPIKTTETKKVDKKIDPDSGVF